MYLPMILHLHNKKEHQFIIIIIIIIIIISYRVTFRKNVVHEFSTFYNIYIYIYVCVCVYIYSEPAAPKNDIHFISV